MYDWRIYNVIHAGNSQIHHNEFYIFLNILMETMS